MPKVSQQYKKERREKLISAAELVFLRLGYSRATIKDVMDEAGVSRGGLYLYFGNKAEIFQSVLERQDRRFFTDVDKLLKSDDPIGPALLQLVTPGANLEQQDRQRVAMVVEYHLDHRDDPEQQEAILTRFDVAISLLIKVIQKGVNRGEFTPRMSIDGIAWFVMTALDGFAVHATVIGADRYNSREYGESMAFFLHQSLGF
jgi:AcrR family transcriptional regulator